MGLGNCLPSTQPCMKDQNTEDQIVSSSTADYLLIASLRLDLH